MPTDDFELPAPIDFKPTPFMVRLGPGIFQFFRKGKEGEFVPCTMEKAEVVRWEPNDL